jgi:hypothetical protein
MSPEWRKTFIMRPTLGDTEMKHLKIFLAILLLGWGIDSGLFADRAIAALQEATFVVT